MSLKKMIFLGLIFVVIIPLFSAAGAEISPEKKVGYANMPAVVVVSTEWIGTLKNYNSSPLNVLDKNGTKVQLVFPQFKLRVLGSGFIVSQDGYIVTSAHVVNMKDTELRSEFAQLTVAWAESNYPSLFSTKDGSINSTQNTSNSLINILKSYNIEYQQQIYVYFGSLDQVSSNGHPADVRRSSSLDTWQSLDGRKYRSGKDIAIIKIEGFDNLPTVTLGDSNMMEVGDKVILIGYPGITYSWKNALLSSTTDFVPTVTSGILGAKKKLPDESDVLQTDAAMYHGDSGCPAFNDNGEVIGISDFGSGHFIEPGEWIDDEGYNFLIPINIAKEFLDEMRINATTSSTTQHFEKGLTYYWNKDYSNAEKEFNWILTEGDSDNLYAKDYLKMTTKK
jgi:serine protease Do